MGLKKKFKGGKKSKGETRPAGESSPSTLPRGKDDYIIRWKKAEQYYCNLFQITDSELHYQLLSWAIKNPLRFKKYENLVRAGEVLEAIQFGEPFLKEVKWSDFQRQDKETSTSTKKSLKISKKPTLSAKAKALFSKKRKS